VSLQDLTFSFDSCYGVTNEALLSLKEIFSSLPLLKKIRWSIPSNDIVEDEYRKSQVAAFEQIQEALPYKQMNIIATNIFT